MARGTSIPWDSHQPQREECKAGPTAQIEKSDVHFLSPAKAAAAATRPRLPSDLPLSPSPTFRTDTMMEGEDPQERPEAISSIISGLERYNPEAVGVLEDYLRQQCEQRYTDCNANRTLLKL